VHNTTSVRKWVTANPGNLGFDEYVDRYSSLTRAHSMYWHHSFTLLKVGSSCVQARTRDTVTHSTIQDRHWPTTASVGIAHHWF
jgi:hypothetical protein